MRVCQIRGDILPNSVRVKQLFFNYFLWLLEQINGLKRGYILVKMLFLACVEFTSNQV
jgi:hypothetical protein